MNKLWMSLLVLLLTLSGPAIAQKKSLPVEKLKDLPDEIRAKIPNAKEHAMIVAERDFSNLSGEKGIQEAFLTFLADDAVIVQVHHTDAVGAKPREKLALRLGDLLDAAERARVSGADVGDEADVGLGDLAQSLDLPEVAG